MTKTVKQVVDEYIAKQKEPKYDYESIRIVSIQTTSWEDVTYYNVSDLEEYTNTENKDGFDDIYFTYVEGGVKIGVKTIGRVVSRKWKVEE